MTDLERKYIDLSKKEDFELSKEQIDEIRSELDSEDAAALIAVITLRLALREENGEEAKALWRFIRYLTEIEMPLKFTDFTFILFPGNSKYFANILTPTAFNIIQRQAKLMLDNEKYENEEHKEHLEKIVNGQMPYGFSLEVPSQENKE